MFFRVWERFLKVSLCFYRNLLRCKIPHDWKDWIPRLKYVFATFFYILYKFFRNSTFQISDYQLRYLNFGILPNVPRFIHFSLSCLQSWKLFTWLPCSPHRQFTSSRHLSNMILVEKFHETFPTFFSLLSYLNFSIRFDGKRSRTMAKWMRRMLERKQMI